MVAARVAAIVAAIASRFVEDGVLKDYEKRGTSLCSPVNHIANTTKYFLILQSTGLVFYFGRLKSVRNDTFT
jgi:hypothetical protein